MGWRVDATDADVDKWKKARERGVPYGVEGSQSDATPSAQYGALSQGIVDP